MDLEERLRPPGVLELLVVSYHKPQAVLPYLALCFHPRSLVSFLLQNGETHQEWEVNPSFLLHDGTKQTISGVLPNIYLSISALPRASVLGAYLVGHLCLVLGDLFRGQLRQKHQNSPLDQSLQDQENHPCLLGEPDLHVLGGLLF